MELIAVHILDRDMLRQYGDDPLGLVRRHSRDLEVAGRDTSCLSDFAPGLDPSPQGSPRLCRENDGQHYLHESSAVEVLMLGELWSGLEFRGQGEQVLLIRWRHAQNEDCVHDQSLTTTRRMRLHVVVATSGLEAACGSEGRVVRFRQPV